MEASDFEERNLSLKVCWGAGVKMDAAQCEPLEEIFKRLQFFKLDLETCQMDDEAASALFDMVEYYESARSISLASNRSMDSLGWQACSRLLKKNQKFLCQPTLNRPNIPEPLHQIPRQKTPRPKISNHLLSFQDFSGRRVLMKGTNTGVQSSTLQQLEVRNSSLSEHSLLIMGRALRFSSGLNCLRLDNCSMSGRPLVILSAALKMNTSLQELHLADNKLGATDGLQLGNLLKENYHLRLLNLAGNNLQVSTSNLTLRSKSLGVEERKTSS
ncbi:PPP1R37 [Cordylochernes scorpioides]|uniref:PPP1R37 n=1 Tax=Cordylochernes scorpioides TaxID=51811 RepID=A0ABY6K4A2_9ARAC|nr:PPP1R37 [Cordylochernes scorpioides]